MKAKLRLVLSISIIFIGFSGFSQKGYWRLSSSVQKSLKSAYSDKAIYYDFDQSLFAKGLEVSRTNQLQRSSVDFPDADGRFDAFILEETPVFHPELSKRYPGIKSYSGRSVDGTKKIKLSVSHKGIQASIRKLNGGNTTLIQKVSKNKRAVYVTYTRKELASKADYLCSTMMGVGLLQKSRVSKLVDDQTLRKFRIAVSTTAEYTDYHGGTVADALAAINATLTRVNDVFETDLGVTLELIANNDDVIYLDTDTDPYNGNLNSQVQSTLTSVIGEENYDVGHLFHNDTNNGNAGFIGSVCVDNRKGSAFSSAVIPEGDSFDLDYVSHELGHQFGANHTWSFESEGTGVQAEPGSGTTIMGYAGIVEGNNVAPNGDDYFHYNSIVQISDYLETVSCAQTTALTNSPPVITPVNDFIIPKSTAFVLTGSASDPDIDDVLSYTWEQIDNGVVTASVFGPNNPTGANFRSLSPSLNGTRYFPRLSQVAAGELAQINPDIIDTWETVSDIQREFNFALTVRDNASGGGQVRSDLVNVNVVNGAGPFSVTSQDTEQTYEAGSVIELAWEVANTDQAPINAETVDVFLSLDGGNSYPILLAQNIVNDGNAQIQLTGDVTNQGRLMVKARDNIFFAVNSANFIIEASPIVLKFDTLDYSVCVPNDIMVPFDLETYAGFSDGDNVNFSAEGPVGLAIAFSPTDADTNQTPIEVTLSDIATLAPGVYPIKIIGTTTSHIEEVTINLNVYDNSYSDVVLLLPADGELNTFVRPELLWQQNVNYSSFDIEIATDEGFTAVVEANTALSNSYTPQNLQPETLYYWRVKPLNDCGEGTFGPSFSFTTTALDCESFTANNLPLEISAIGVSTETRSIALIEDLRISDVNVSLELDHTYLEDLVITLISPSGTKVVLLSSQCGNFNDISAIFDDDGTEVVCSATSPSISGNVKPLGSLDSFKGESTLGEWVLEIADMAAGDGGELTSFSLDICVEGSFRPDDDEDGVFDDGQDLCLGTPKGVEVDTNGCAVYRFPEDNFTVAVSNETCRSNNDGTIVVSVADSSIDYSANFVGDGINETIDFNNGHSFQNLSAGNYSLCITGVLGGISYNEVCYNLVLDQPEVLDVSSTLNSSTQEVTLNLNGSAIYNLELNGIVTQTQEDLYTLSLKDGYNVLKVYSNLPCQGVFEEEFILADKPFVYPNPMETEITVVFPSLYINVSISIFDVSGKLYYFESIPEAPERLGIDATMLSTGMYFMRLKAANLDETLKIIKP